MVCSLKVISLRNCWRWKWFKKKKTNRGGVKNNLKGHLPIAVYPFSLHFIAVHLFPPGLWKTLLLAHWPAPLLVSLHPSIPLDLEFPWPPGSAQLWKVVATAAACFAASCEYWQELTSQYDSQGQEVSIGLHLNCCKPYTWGTDCQNKGSVNCPSSWRQQLKH